MQKIRKLTLLGLALMLAGCSTPSAVFDKIDANDNSKISSEEFIAHVQKSAFDDIDTDGNAYLDSDEWKVAETSNEPRKRFTRLDKNRDGRVSLKEFADVPSKKRTLKRIFETIDSDDDGFISPSEIEANEN